MYASGCRLRPMMHPRAWNTHVPWRPAARRANLSGRGIENVRGGMVSKSRDLMVSRAAAGLIDAAIAAALGGVAARLVGWALALADVDQDLREPVERLVLLGAFCLYSVLTTAGRGQATWGQRWLGLIVLGAEGGRPGRGEAFARWLAYLATLLPLGAGLLLALGPDHRPFHDRLCAGSVARRSNAPGARSS